VLYSGPRYVSCTLPLSGIFRLRLLLFFTTAHLLSILVLHANISAELYSLLLAFVGLLQICSVSSISSISMKSRPLSRSASYKDFLIDLVCSLLLPASCFICFLRGLLVAGMGFHRSLLFAYYKSG
jgi:hypothetical protein